MYTVNMHTLYFAINWRVIIIRNIYNVLFISFHREDYLEKIQKRIRDYKIDIINEPRPDKKLLVLDIDYTLFGECSLIWTFRISISSHIEHFLILFCVQERCIVYCINKISTHLWKCMLLTCQSPFS